MRAAAFIQIVFAGLGALAMGATVLFSCSHHGGFYSGLNAPAILTVVLGGYVVSGIASLRSSTSRGGVVGLLLLVPLVSTIASIFDFESRGFVLGSAPGALFGVTSLVMALKARKNRAGAASEPRP